jgi:cytoskeletal protein CcmA (bactofilin family)
VNSYIAVAALISVASLMFMLPLVPALVELHRKSDALPLVVVQQNAGEIRHFANSFRSYIKDLQPILQRCVRARTTAGGMLPDGEEYVVLGRADELLLRGFAEGEASHPVLIMAGVGLSVPPLAKFSKDIYAGEQFEGGEKNSYRAILGEREVHLGIASDVVRWVHAVGAFTADYGCNLYGRISSDSVIRLGEGCSFLRMNAPRIEIGQSASAENPSTPETMVPSDANAEKQPRLLHDGDYEIVAGQVMDRNIVIRGNLRIRAGARICGSVKSVKDMVIENGVSVEGSLISARKMHVGQNCRIHGPVIAERELSIAGGTQCGTSGFPTTVSAPQIEVEEGVVVFGTLWAREHGHVVARA